MKSLFCRNPFVSQVNFFRHWQEVAYNDALKRRNPFVSQVNFFKLQAVLSGPAIMVAIPS